MTTYKLAEHVSVTEVDGEAVLLDLQSGAYYGLNHIGAQLLTALAQNKSMTQITQDVASHYDMASEQVSADFEALIAELQEHQLLITV